MGIWRLRQLRDQRDNVRVIVSGSLMNSWAVMALFAIPSQVIWSYSAGGGLRVVGLVAMLLRAEWQKAGGFETLIVRGPLSYAAPIAAFGAEHFTLTESIASIVPAWIPSHQFWLYFVGTCFIAA